MVDALCATLLTMVTPIPIDPPRECFQFILDASQFVGLLFSVLFILLQFVSLCCIQSGQGWWLGGRALGGDGQARLGWFGREHFFHTNCYMACTHLLFM